MKTRRLRAYIQRHRRAYLTGFALSLGSIGLSLVNPWILRQAIDGIRAGVSPLVLVGLAAAYVGVALLGAFVRFHWRMKMLGAGRRIEYEIRNDYFAHLQRLHQGFFQHTRTGDLMARAINDLNAVSRMVSAGLMHSANTVVMFLAASALMVAIDPTLALVVLLILPMVSVVFVALGRRIHRQFEAVQEQFSVLSARAQENFSGVRVVKAYAQEEAEIRAFDRASREYVLRSLRQARTSGALWPAMTLILGLAAAAVLWQGGTAVAAGRITLGQLVQFFGYLMMLSWPMIALGWTVTLFQQGLASMGRLEEILEVKPTVADPPVPVARGRLRGEIEFCDVAVAFDGTPVLRGINLRIPAGATVAIVGPTGAGKTTLVSLIPRLFDPTQGAVLIDGVDIRRLPLATLRAHIGLVPQEPFLFSDTLEENLAFGLDGTDGQRVREAAEIAQLARDVGDFPLGYQTVLGERGVTLSGGQKQRATLARALARDPAILILDDALSSVDARTEEEILRGLRRIIATRTSLIISHRISTVRGADLIVVLEAGRIVEQGTHDALLAAGGLYADLYEKQLLREALEAEEAGAP
ncbi:MAG: ABC transporter ATP-binding protein [Armatimonadota bacterium]|nr:ABC transporter ATP-binding protein [Armatimonadota bacterium]MDR7548932.1 ABC transporter ATP-binding protein [Armatimonadota bacterium]